MRRAALAFLVAATVLAAAAPALAQQQTQRQELFIKMRIRADGSLAVREVWRLGLPPAEDDFFIEYTGRRLFIGGASVTEQPTVLSPGPTARIQYPLPYREVSPGEPPEPETFSLEALTDTDGVPAGARIRARFAPGVPERQLEFGYRVLGAIRRYDDVAELRWPFVSSGVARVRTEVEVPEGGSGEVLAWAHGNFEAEVQGRTVYFTRSTGTHPVDGRLVMPSEALPGLNRIGGLRLPQILAEEQAQVPQVRGPTEYPRDVERGAPFVALIVVLGMLALALGARPASRLDPLPPAVAAAIVRYGRVGPRDAVATIADLARRGYVEIGEEPGDGAAPRITFAVSSEGWDALYPYERALLVLLRSAGDVNARDGASLRAWAEAAPQLVQARMRGFSRMVIEHARRRGLGEPSRVPFAMLSAVLSLTGIVVALGALTSNARDAAVLIVLGSITAFGAALAPLGGAGRWVSFGSAAAIALGAATSATITESAGALTAAMVCAAGAVLAPVFRAFAYASRTERTAVRALRDAAITAEDDLVPDPIGVVLGAPVPARAGRTVSALQGAFTPRKTEDVGFWSGGARAEQPTR